MLSSTFSSSSRLSGLFGPSCCSASSIRPKKRLSSLFINRRSFCYQLSQRFDEQQCKFFTVPLRNARITTSRCFNATSASINSTTAGRAGGSRKLRRRKIQDKTVSSTHSLLQDRTKSYQTGGSSIPHDKVDDGSYNGGRNNEPLYPKGQPWRVLWPVPNGHSACNQWKLRHIPGLKDFRRAWTLYKATWEDGISGRPSEAKLQSLREEELAKRTLQGTNVEGPANNSADGTFSEQQLQIVGDNAARNLQIARQDAQKMLQVAKERTGIHTQEDLKAFATQMMKLSTECIREFMAGYRKGRDEEIDKMLNEYFRNDNIIKQEMERRPDEKTIVCASDGLKRKKRRSPKRGIPRV
ncbi:hypothetical protein IV203_016575 [Nitzschia inconspicua]|uniref:Uncharacterized protein n=1 Tax=Nitzschia inconspicua TaxID=303405 RepID=A0A9K3KQ92_9STRA|nr:hypothetical protein IV203_016575 [Nitzschia inconspicua]